MPLTQNEKCISEILIRICTKDYSKEVFNFMEEKKIPFKAWKIHQFKEEFNNIDEDLNLIEVDPDIYQKLKKLSEITGIPIGAIVSMEMGDFFFSVGDNPVIFLNRHLRIENIENPIEMLKIMKDLIHIPENYLESLKSREDLIREIEMWKNPLNSNK